MLLINVCVCVRMMLRNGMLLINLCVCTHTYMCVKLLLCLRRRTIFYVATLLVIVCVCVCGGGGGGGL